MRDASVYLQLSFQQNHAYQLRKGLSVRSLVCPVLRVGRILKGFGGSKSRRLAGLNVNFFPRLRVSSLASCPFAKLKVTKSGQAHLLSGNDILT